VIQDLGDQQDGWDNKTVRGGHELEQDMSNEEMFEVCFDAYVDLLEWSFDQGVANRIEYQSVVNSNHSASFSHVLGIAIKKYINRLYDEEVLSIDLLKTFIEVREWGNHAFLITHGKDAKYMKNGLPYKLTPNTINFISDIIDHRGIDHSFVHVYKGDMHQIGYDGSQVKFDYRNFGSFCPPSNHLQHNYGNGRSSFAIQVIEKAGALSHSDIQLNYKKVV